MSPTLPIAVEQLHIPGSENEKARLNRAGLFTT
jgi:hypothetical protein